MYFLVGIGLSSLLPYVDNIWQSLRTSCFCRKDFDESLLIRMPLLILFNGMLCSLLIEDYMELLCNISDFQSSEDEVTNFLGFTVTIGISQYSVVMP